jgi:predicted PurR-regulated permease PerM
LVAVLLLATSLGLAWILLPFYGTILWGSIIALLFRPLYCGLLPPLKGRRTAAALFTLLIVLLIVVLPLALLTASLAHEASLMYRQLESGEANPVLYLRGVFDALPGWSASLLNRFGLADFDDLQRRLVEALTQGSRFLATQAFSIGQNTFEVVASLFIALYLAFFLLRDGDRLMRSLRRAIPLSPGHQQELLDKFDAVVRATVRGNLLVAAIQGALGGIAFWFLGIGGALLWAVIMAFLSLLPVIGAGLVWVPCALYLLVTGSVWQAIALTVYGVLVIGLVDNLLRPVLVGKDTLMPDYMVMMTTLGGMVVFGVNGFVVGPTIAAMFVAVWHIHVSMRDAPDRSSVRQRTDSHAGRGDSGHG